MILRRSVFILLITLCCVVFVSAQQRSDPTGKQAPPSDGARSGSLKQIIPGHYLYSTSNGGRPFNSGVIVTAEGVVVIDALDSAAVARAERDSISTVSKEPVRYLVSSSFHDPFSKGNTAYAGVHKIGHENYRAGLVDQMKRGNISVDEQQARLPNATFRDRMSLFLGGKEIQVLYFGRAHTLGDAIVFVPQDRIAYLSEVFFCDEFPNMAQGYGVAWVKVLDSALALGADIFVPGHGPIPEDPKGTRAGLQRLRQILTDMRDAIQKELARGATEDQVVASVKLEQYEKMPNYAAQREVSVRRMYKELSGSLP